MNIMKHNNGIDILKDTLKNIICKITDLLMICLIVTVMLGMKLETVMNILGITLISYSFMGILTDLCKISSRILKTVRKNIFLCVIVSLSLLYEYIINDPFGLEKTDLSNRNKLFICSGFILLLGVIHLVQKRIEGKAYNGHIDERYITVCRKFNNESTRKAGKSRCPWCGELTDISENAFRKNSINSDRCNNCGNYAIPYNDIIEKILNPGIDIVLFVMLVFIRKFLLLSSVLYLAAKLFYYSFFRYYVPYKRINGKSKDTRVSEEILKEEFLSKANIIFNLSKWKIFKFWNNKILIIIAVDENRIAISHPLCVRIIRCNNEYELTKIGRQVKFNVSEGQRFFVYLGAVKIGEGYFI